MFMLYDIDSFYWRKNVENVVVVFRAPAFSLSFGGSSLFPFPFFSPLSHFPRLSCRCVAEGFPFEHHFFIVSEIFSFRCIFVASLRLASFITSFVVTSEVIAKENFPMVGERENFLIIQVTTRRNFRYNGIQCKIRPRFSACEPIRNVTAKSHRVLFSNVVLNSAEYNLTFLSF